MEVLQASRHEGQQLYGSLGPPVIDAARYCQVIVLGGSVFVEELQLSSVITHINFCDT